MKLKSKLLALGAVAAFSGYALAADESSGSSDQRQQQQQQQQNAASLQQSGTWQKAQAQEFFRSSQIVGKGTQDSKRQKLGEIKEVVFNQQGEVFALIELGDKWAAVPWSLINTASAKGNQNLVVNTTQQQLKSAPAVTKDQWGSLNNPNFTQSIYSYFKVQSPVATGGAASPGGASQGQGSSAAQQPSFEQQQQQPPPTSQPQD